MQTALTGDTVIYDGNTVRHGTLIMLNRVPYHDK